MFSFIFLKFYKYKKVFKKDKDIKFNKSNLNKWMNLTKKERFDLSKNESNSYFQKRKSLLEEIRKEYKSISKNDQKSLWINKILENYWTSKKSIHGLRHFVLVNKINEQNQINFLMVSVVDVEISLKISKDE